MFTFNILSVFNHTIYSKLSCLFHFGRFGSPQLVSCCSYLDVRRQICPGYTPEGPTVSTVFPECNISCSAAVQYQAFSNSHHILGLLPSTHLTVSTPHLQVLQDPFHIHCCCINRAASFRFRCLLIDLNYVIFFFFCFSKPHKRTFTCFVIVL